MTELSERIVSLIQHSKQGLAKATNVVMLHTYYMIGKLIVEELQEGKNRAEYGMQLLKTVSEDLTNKLGRGFSVQNLERMRNLFLMYSNSSSQLRNSELFEKSSKHLGIFEGEEIRLLPIS